jgi:hypothetical protein
MGGEQSCGSTRLATDAGFPSLPSEKAFQSVRGELAGFPVGMPSLAREVPPSSASSKRATRADEHNNGKTFAP